MAEVLIWQGTEDLLQMGGDQILPVIPLCIQPLKRALSTRDKQASAISLLKAFSAFAMPSLCSEGGAPRGSRKKERKLDLVYLVSAEQKSSPTKFLLQRNSIYACRQQLLQSVRGRTCRIPKHSALYLQIVSLVLRRKNVDV